MSVDPSVSAESDPDLPAVRRVLEGDPSAFGEIVERHQRSLRRLLVGLVADRDLAEDVLQESFLIAYRQLASFRGTAQFKTWLSRITVREGMRARSRVRRIWQLVTPVEDAHLEHVDDDHRPVGQAMQDREEAQELLAHLPVKERAAFVMFAEGWSHSEISVTLQSPMGTVASWIHRAKGRLNRLLETRKEEARAEEAGRPALPPPPGAVPTRKGTT